MMVEQPEPEVEPRRNKGGRPPKNAVVRSERVNMMWTPALKEAVRERVGTRGLTDWVIDAVEEKLAAAPPRTIEEMREHQDRKTEVHDRLLGEPVRQNGRPVEQVESAPEPVLEPVMEPVLEPVTERFGSSTGGLSDMLNRAAAIGVKTDDQGEPPWVTGPVLAPPIIVDDPSICPTCGEPRIDGECWTCD